MTKSRVYFDHAATSWPRMPGVVQAMCDFELNNSTAAGRSDSAVAAATNRSLEMLRAKLRELVNAAPSSRIAFFNNGTAANNYALAGMLRTGDHVITTAAEHNSILRPLALLERQRQLRVTTLPVNCEGVVDASKIEDAITSETRLIAISSASNVTGALQDIATIGKIVSRSGARFFVDAAQTLGYLPLDMQQCKIDVLASPGHKGAGGPLGTGMLVVTNRVTLDWQPLWIGGTGSDSELLDGDLDWQQVAESGNRNSTALLGWLVGLTSILNQSSVAAADDLENRLHRLVRILRNSLIGSVIGHEDNRLYAPVVSLKCEPNQSGMMPADWSALLDASFSIETRAGLHCAGRIHPHLGTEELGGTLRFSIGHTTTDADLDALELAMNLIRKQFPLREISVL